jgi:hypothetical protein
MAINVTIEVVCPSGLTGRMRGMKVKDEQLFLDPKLKKAGLALSHLLDACWVETLDSGPYKEPLNWISQISSADRTYALIQLRIASYGEDFDFQVTCESCNHTFGWGINLNDLDTIPTSEAGRKCLTSGQPIEHTLSCGEIVKTKLSTGADESYIQNLGPKDRTRFLTLHLARRIVEINKKTLWHDIISEVEELPSRYAGELWNSIDEHEGGVDTSFMVECPKCDREQKVQLPFTAAFFSNRKALSDSPKR